MLYALRVFKKKSASGLTIEFIMQRIYPLAKLLDVFATMIWLDAFLSSD